VLGPKVTYVTLQQQGNYIPCDTSTHAPPVLKLLHLPTGTQWPVKSDECVPLICRNVYDDLYEWTKQNKYTLIKGNPGIGKSCALNYFLYRLLGDKKNVIVSTTTNCWYFDSSMRMALFKGGKDAYRGVLEIFGTARIQARGAHDVPSATLLFDADNEHHAPSDSDVPTIVVSSPDPQQFKSYKKQKKAKSKVVEVWSEEEMKAARDTVFPDVPVDTCTKRIQELGPIPRHVFGTTADYDEESVQVKKAVADLDVTMLHLYDKELKDTRLPSHRIMKLMSDDRHEFLTHHIAQMVMEKMSQIDIDAFIRGMKNILGADGIGGSIWGAVFENYFHRVAVDVDSFLNASCEECERPRTRWGVPCNGTANLQTGGVRRWVTAAHTVAGNVLQAKECHISRH
jgi:hypothetical protein